MNRIIVFGLVLTALLSACTSHPAPNGSATPSTQGSSEQPIPGASAESIPLSTPPPASPAPSEKASVCRSGAVLANVYHPYRLTVISRCRTVTGVVETIRSEADSDVHFDLKLDAQYASLINDRNRTGQHGYLVAEVVPADEPGCRVGQAPRASTGTYRYGICTGADIRTPPVGSHVSITGSYVLDRDHGWMEIHPVWRVVYLGGAPPSSTARAAGLRITSISPNPVNPGQNITLSAQTSARVSCSITVTYASGTVSRAAGLEPTSASSSGRVSWTWKVGTRTGAGTATADVVCGGRSAQGTFRVT